MKSYASDVGPSPTQKSQVIAVNPLPLMNIYRPRTPVISNMPIMAYYKLLGIFSIRVVGMLISGEETIVLR